VTIYPFSGGCKEGGPTEPKTEDETNKFIPTGEGEVTAAEELINIAVAMEGSQAIKEAVWQPLRPLHRGHHVIYWGV